MVSSLLPSALSDKLDNMRPNPQQANSQMKKTTINYEEEDEEGIKRKDMHDDPHKKEKKKKLSHEVSPFLLLVVCPYEWVSRCMNLYHISV